MPVSQIAVMLGVSVEEVAEAIDEMEKDKIILKYSPIIDWDRTQKTRVEAMISGQGDPAARQGV
jgi:DNA-binding Lrp family transcriptional regulator